MGVRRREPQPPAEQWATGIFETTTSGFGGPAAPRRLVLRHAMASPDKGLIFELYQPLLIQADDTGLRFRGIEGVTLCHGEIGGMVQEWLVRLLE